MRDGVALLADRWFPAAGGGSLLVVRSPYGRRGMFGFLYGRLFAERGFQVLVQSCRGTFGSEGDFTPMVDEADDAGDTIAWLREQTWFGGSFATLGASYLCFDQWALAASRPPELRAMVAEVGPHDFAPSIYPGGAFALDTSLGFAAQVSSPERSALLTMLGQVWRRHRLRIAHRELPLIDSYARALRTRVDFVEQWLEHEEHCDPFWDSMDHTDALAGVNAAVLLQGGWYDLFAAATVGQYQRLKERGLRPHLTMGPWTHGEFGMRAWRTLLPETLAWLRAHLDDGDGQLRARPVRVFVLGADEWREYDDWPPCGCRETAWYLAPGGQLSRSVPTTAGADCYRYDPADPTPSIGGPLLLFGAGPKDNRALEARGDVLTFTSEPLDDEVTVFGSPTIELHLSSPAASIDVFARLCDVSPGGRSTNICDGLVRLTRHEDDGRADRERVVRLALSPTACRFGRGHRLRLQVSSGAHPRFARNPGTGDPTSTATRLVPVDQTVLVGPVHRSHISFLCASREAVSAQARAGRAPR